MGILFIKEGLQLVSIYTKDVKDAAVVKIREEEKQLKYFVNTSLTRSEEKQTYYRSPIEKQTTKRSFQKTKLM